jgi:hypothetical protein
MANNALDLLERYREVALIWTVNHRAAAESMSRALHERLSRRPPRRLRRPSRWTTISR